MMELVTQFQNIHWREPLWFFIALYPVVIYIIKVLFSKRNIARYVEAHLQPWVLIPDNIKLTHYLFSKNSLYFIAWILFATALSGPRVPIHQPDKENYLTSNIMIVLDTSLSMQGTDITPDRLHRAKLEIYELLDKAQNHRIGITIFSARPHLYVPLTSDYKALRTYLNTVDKIQLPTSGSDPVAAIQFAIDELTKTNGKSSILLISDGDESIFSDINIFSTLTALTKADIPLYILGAGTVEGSAILLSDGTWLMHNKHPVISRMNEPLLQTLANQYNGKYSSIRDNDSDWQTLYSSGIALHRTVINIDKNEQVVWNELYRYFLIPSILFFVFSLSTIRLNIFKKSTTSLVFIFLFSIVSDKDASAFTIISTDEQKAYKAYLDKNYTLASELYKNISGYNGYMGLATSLYKMGDYQASVQPFTLAILAANTDYQRKIALYNLGNSYLHNGKFTQAIAMYEDALRYQPDHKESLYNLTLSKTLQDTLIKNQNQEAQRIMPRQGQGPRSAQLSDNTEISDSTSVSLGESKNIPGKELPLPDIPNIHKDTLRQLLQLGFENIQLVEQETNTSSIIKSKSIQGITEAQLYLNELNEDQATLWKRLFEIEEGFPAPVEKARTIPGIDPW